MMILLRCDGFKFSRGNGLRNRGLRDVRTSLAGGILKYKFDTNVLDGKDSPHQQLPVLFVKKYKERRRQPSLQVMRA